MVDFMLEEFTSLDIDCIRNPVRDDMDYTSRTLPIHGVAVFSPIMAIPYLWRSIIAEYCLRIDIGSACSDKVVSAAMAL